MTVPDAQPQTREWFHEYGWTGAEDFEAAQEAVEALGFTFVYGGADARPDWPGWPAHADVLAARLDTAEREREQMRLSILEYAEATGVLIHPVENV